MYKGIAAIVLLVPVALLAGCGQKAVPQEYTEATATDVRPPIVDDTNAPKWPNEGDFIENLCNNGLETYYESKFAYDVDVLSCGEHYSLTPISLLDAGRVLVDRNGNKVAACGGMPGESPTPANSMCEIACAATNLCIGIEVDCAAIRYENTPEDRWTGADEKWYAAMRNGCYLQNTLRMNDKKYCENITDDFQKDQCLRYEPGV